MWTNKNWEQSIRKVHDTIYLLLNNNKTHHILTKFIERDIIGPTSFERKMVNEMSINIDPTKLILYFNLIKILLDLWNTYLSNTTNENIQEKFLNINIDYPCLDLCLLKYNCLNKYDKQNKNNKRNVHFPEQCFFMLHRLIENIYLTTQNKYVIIQNEMETFNKYISKIETQQNEHYEPQREYQKSIIMEKIARLSPHYYTFADYLTSNNIQHNLGIFYEKSGIWIVQNLENIYDNNEQCIPIMENIIDNFSEFMHQHIKTLNIRSTTKMKTCVQSQYHYYVYYLCCY